MPVPRRSPARPALAGLAALGLLAACAAPRALSGPGGPGASAVEPGEPPSAATAPPAEGVDPALSQAVVAGALGRLGTRGPFVSGGERFNDDCSGFVSAVYADAGIPLRALMRTAAPDETVGTAAAFRAAQAYGETFGPDHVPAPGDLVFWHDTYDRNRNGRADDEFTHVGIVEAVGAGTVRYLHRGARGVARGHMTVSRPRDVKDLDGRPLNSPLRERNEALAGVPSLAGALFAAYGRIDPRRIPPPPPDAVASR